MKNLTLILGNQLFDYKHYRDLEGEFFMCEDRDLCTHFKYHKHKIIHFLASMREYSDLLTDRKRKVHYFPLSDKPHFFDVLRKLIKDRQIERVSFYEIEDHFFAEAIKSFLEKLNIPFIELNSPMFLCPRDQFLDYLNSANKPFMNSFYIRERKRLNILMEEGKPLGGKWSYDQENRKKIPKKFVVDDFLPPPLKNQRIEEVKKLVKSHFSEHPGDCENYWIPTNRADSIKWFKTYLKERFEFFGDFQDAIDQRTPFLYHSVISPMMNIGFLTPDEVIREVEKLVNPKNLNSCEGFIRQVMGWREFVRGIYQNFDTFEQEENFFQHKRKLTQDWYKGTTGIPPLDDSIKKANEWGYCHHIERLMVIGNIMLLLEVDPQEVFRWFMEMFVDSSDWVMGPNVFGMSQFSDGGLFATKPYIAGSNYLKKMSHYKDDQWCEAIDGLYWQFIDKKREFLKSNPRLNMMIKTLEKMDPERKKRIYSAADQLKNKITKG